MFINQVYYCFTFTYPVLEVFDEKRGFIYYVLMRREGSVIRLITVLHTLSLRFLMRKEGSSIRFLMRREDSVIRFIIILRTLSLRFLTSALYCWSLSSACCSTASRSEIKSFSLKIHK